MSRHPIIESIRADIDGLDFADDEKRQDAEDSIICTVQTLIDRFASKDTALAEIRAEREAFEKDCEYWSSETARVCGEASTLAAELERERELKDHARKCCDAAESELARVKKALEPFAALNVPAATKWTCGTFMIEHDDIRAASRALSQDGEERS
ncbi:hypothetical protein [Mesorhizobium sp. URHB0026]